MELPPFVIYLSAGAYIAIMLAVLGVPQLLSSYFDIRARRLERQENEANTERRHQEMLAAQTRREEREEERRRQDEERRRQELDNVERRHQEMMVAVMAALTRGNGNGEGQNVGQSEVIRTLQQTIEDLRTENELLRRERDNGESAHSQ